MMFGALFYIGLVQCVIMTIAFIAYVVKQTGQSSGIGLMFAVFVFYIALELITYWRYGKSVSAFTACKTSIQRLSSSLLAYAESISLLRSQIVELRVLQRKLWHLFWSLITNAHWFMMLYIPIGIMMQFSPLATFVLPAVIYFFLHYHSDMTAADATSYLFTISFYGYLFSQLSNIMQLTESAMHAVTIGNRLYALKQQIIQVNKLMESRASEEVMKGIRSWRDDTFELRGLTVSIPDFRSPALESTVVMQRSLHVSLKTGNCMIITAAKWARQDESLSNLCWTLAHSFAVIDIIFRYCDASTFRVCATKTVSSPWHFTIAVVAHGSRCVSFCFTAKRQITMDILVRLQLQDLAWRFGFDTITDWPNKVSDGEAQRLTFARIFAFFQFGDATQRPRLLLFDESSSALDVEMEAVVTKSSAYMVLGTSQYLIAQVCSHFISINWHSAKLLTLPVSFDNCLINMLLQPFHVPYRCPLSLNNPPSTIHTRFLRSTMVQFPRPRKICHSLRFCLNTRTLRSRSSKIGFSLLFFHGIRLITLYWQRGLYLLFRLRLWQDIQWWPTTLQLILQAYTMCLEISYLALLPFHMLKTT